MSTTWFEQGLEQGLLSRAVLVQSLAELGL